MVSLKFSLSWTNNFIYSAVIHSKLKSRANKLVGTIVMSTISLAACGPAEDTSASDSDSGVATFTIGGSVSGLTGEVLLQNNGEVELALIKNGTYVFPTKLANAFDYSVTVKSQPIGQECSVQNGIGVISSANNLNVVIACADLDTDGDGLSDSDEIIIYLTDPTVADTDGDGLDDFNEIVTKSFNSADSNYIFNPLIADEPKLEIVIMSTPVISINYYYDEAIIDSISTERSDTNSTAITRGFGSSETIASEQTHTQSVEVSASGGISLEGPSYDTSVTVNEEFSQSTSRSQTVDFSEGQSEENATALAEAIGLETSNTVSSSSGSIETTVRMKNTSNIAYEVEGLTLSAYTKDPNNPYDVSSIGTLTYLDGANSSLFPPQTIGPGAQSEVLNFSLKLSVDAANGLKPLLGSPNIIVAPVVGRLTGNGDINFLLDATEVVNQTGLVSIDYGPFEDAENYRVATYDGERGEGISFDRLMNGILKIPFTSGEGYWLHGTETVPRLSFNGITSVRDKAMDDAKSGYWVVSHTHSIPNSIQTTTDVYNLILGDFDLDAFVFNSRDVLRFIYVEDEDRDGLALRSELLNGTDPTKKDTDGDQLIDTLEVTGWFVEIAGEQVSYFSDPLNPNSDQDRSPDNAEFWMGTNPEVADVQLPDTGIGPNQCYQAGSDILGACSNEYLQDGDLGRDANPATNIDTDGKLGFNYTRVGSNGGLSNMDENMSFPCIRDNVTGLTWYRTEVASSDYNSSELSDAVVTFNNSKHCGLDDWRLPTAMELISIVNYGYVNGDSSANEIWGISGYYHSSTINSSNTVVSVGLGGWGNGAVRVQYTLGYAMFVHGGNH